ncbi:MAG: immunoglobulin domain-containing protein [Verrucomicrobiia bacterium]
MKDNFTNRILILSNVKIIPHPVLLAFWLTFISTGDVFGISASLFVWGNNNTGQTNFPSGLTNCSAIAAGKFHALAVLDNGNVIGWGNNELGQLNIPSQAVNVVSVSAGYAHNVALKNDGTVVAWGFNDSGQTNVPYGLSGVIKVVSGDNFNLALLSNGRIVGWGGSPYGNSPSRPPSYLTDGQIPVKDIAAGNSFGMAVDVNGQVYVWGTTDNRVLQIPSALTNLQYNTVAVAGGQAHCLALLDNGTVIGWGNNYYGQANSIYGAKAIAAKGDTSMAILQNNTVAVWGDNTYNQRVAPSGLTNVVSIAVGDGYCMALYLEPVKIVAHPQNQNVVAGGTVNFIVSATGSQPITYQWKHQGTNLPGATNYILTLSNVQSNRAGSYTVVVGNAVSSTESQAATLNVWVPPVITVQPTNQSVPLGGAAQFSITVQGTSPFYYQWRKNGTDIPGATVVPYKILNAQLSDAAEYSVVVSNIAGVVTSQTARLTVNLPPTIIVQPQSQTVIAGASVTFKVIDSGGVSYQWRKNGVNIAGATNSIYTITSVKKDDAGNYSVAVSNPGGTVISQNAVLTVVEPPQGSGMVAIWGESSNIWNGSEYIDLSPPAGLTNVSKLAAGSFHCLALLKDGHLIGWGDNRYGKASISIGNIKAIAAGQDHSIALLSNGTIYVWGNSNYGQTNPPAGLTNIAAIASGLNHLLALINNGVVVGWGKNDYGQATPLPGLTNIVAIAAGADHSLALKNNGTVAAWGKNDDGQTRVPSGLTNVAAIAGGAGHSIALLSNGTVVCWGRNNYGQSTPPAGLSNVMAIAAGENHSVALLSNNLVVCWGADNYGQIETPANLKGVAFISAAGNYTIATYLKPLTLSLSRYLDQPHQLNLKISNLDGTAIEDWRFNQINVYISTNLNRAGTWDKISSIPFYNNGSLIYTLPYTNTAAGFFKVLETP